MHIENQYKPVNWIDGMKLNKDIFLAQHHAHTMLSNNIASLQLSPVKYGLIAQDVAPNIVISIDNQQLVTVNLLQCSAVTQAGALININKSLPFQNNNGENVFQITVKADAQISNYWIVLIVQPYHLHPIGTPDTSVQPLRHPYLNTTYEIEIVTDSSISQYINHPYALVIGKLKSNANEVYVDQDFIPACLSIHAHPDLIDMHAELLVFFSNLEAKSIGIIQKILKKSQKNELSDLTQSICEQMLAYIGPSIHHIKWLMTYEAPIQMIAMIAGLGRTFKNAIDMRLGTGKEELLNYLSDWCELNQGELDQLLATVASLHYNTIDINSNIQTISHFIKTINRLFDTLHGLEFIGKRKESGLFIKEETPVMPENVYQEQPKPKRRFFN
jgi:hypothetical protein